MSPSPTDSPIEQFDTQQETQTLTPLDVITQLTSSRGTVPRLSAQKSLSRQQTPTKTIQKTPPKYQPSPLRKSVITRVSAKTAQNIRAAHTILDAAAVIKELVENALDAHATRIDIRLRGKAALDSIVVSDNGQGIGSDDYNTICMPSTTSKLTGMDDLAELSTFGFRGEALSAIRAVCASLTVLTRTCIDLTAKSITFFPDGSLSKCVTAARPVGTTVTVSKVFHALPVRRKDAVKNSARDIARCVAVVQALAIISTHARLELRVASDVKVCSVPYVRLTDGTKPTAVTLPALRTTAKAVLGTRTTNLLQDVDEDAMATVTIPPYFRKLQSSMKDEEGHSIPQTKAHYACKGLVSSASLDANGSGGRARSSHQYVFINDRPVDLPRLLRSANEVYRRATGFLSASPTLILNLVLPAWSCDVNLAPDKRDVLIHDEETFISGFVQLLERVWIPTTATAIPVQKSQTTILSSFSRHPSQAPPITDDPVDQISLLKEPASNWSKDRSANLENKSSADALTETNVTTKSIPCESSQGIYATEFAGEKNRQATQLTQQPTQLKSDIMPNLFPTAFTPPPLEENDLPFPNPNASFLSSPDDEYSSLPQSLTSPLVNRFRRQEEEISSQKVDVTRAMKVTKVTDIERGNQHLHLNVTSGGKRVREFVERRSRRVSARRTDSSSSTPLYGGGDLDTGIQFGDMAMAEQDNSAVQHIIMDGPPTEGGPVQLGKLPALTVDWDMICNERQDKFTFKSNDDDTKKDSSQRVSHEGFHKASVEESVEMAGNGGNHQDAADRELSRLFRQEWFKKLQVIGQFNRGFIIAKLDDEVFIIDQHASDEKYNFERLQNTTAITKQKLVSPQQLEFSAQDELLVAQHTDALRAGGFDVRYDASKSPTRRLTLHAQPVSKQTMFIERDLQDIVHALRTGLIPNGAKLLRPPRVRAMFATRACRMSIMIGTALHKNQMKRVVSNLADIEHPWTCPHGRPTMRHLCTLSVEEQDVSC